jgi:hypothetical protein
LSGRADRHGRSRTQHETIARHFKIHQDTARNHVRSLKRKRAILSHESKKRRRFNRPNVYTFPNYSPHKTYLNTNTRTTRPRPVGSRITYARLLWEWRGAQMRAQRQQRNHPPEVRKRWEHRERWRKMKEKADKERERLELWNTQGIRTDQDDPPPPSAEDLVVIDALMQENEELEQRERERMEARDAANERRRREIEEGVRRFQQSLLAPPKVRQYPATKKSPRFPEGIIFSGLG